MRKSLALKVLAIATVLLYPVSDCYCQHNKHMSLNPSLEANSEEWKVKENKKMFGGISKPEFGPYTTLIAEKLDTPVIKKRTREGSAFELKLGYDAEIETGKGADIDMSKKVSIQKTKFFRLLLSNGEDSSDALFSLLTISKEKKQTILGKVLSKKDEGKDQVLSYSSFINGIITTNDNTNPWDFYYTSSSSDNYDPYSNDTTKTPGLSGYLKNNSDSLYIEPISFSMGNKYFPVNYTEGFAVINKKGQHVAALQFKKNDNKSIIWIRKDLEAYYRQAISSFLAVLVAI